MKPDNRPATRSWPEVTVVYHPDLAEALTFALLETGASAVEQGEDDQTGRAWSRAGFPEDSSPDELAARLAVRIERLIEIFQPPDPVEVEWRQVPAEDWAEKWKEGLAPLEIGGGLVIKPTWCEYENRQNRKVIEIDPGMAFGTGHHETTALCLEMLEEILSGHGRVPTPDPLKVLDVGTGSGILALAAAALGAGDVTAVDNDPEAVDVAAENLDRNRAAGPVRLAVSGVEALTGRFGLILANLTASTLIDVSPGLLARSRAGGLLVLSGILIEQAADVLEVYMGRGCELVERVDRGEWTALLMRTLGAE